MWLRRKRSKETINQVVLFLSVWGLTLGLAHPAKCPTPELHLWSWRIFIAGLMKSGEKHDRAGVYTSTVINWELRKACAYRVFSMSQRCLQRWDCSPCRRREGTSHTCILWPSSSEKSRGRGQRDLAASSILSDSLSLKYLVWGWKGDSAVRSTYCSSRGPNLGS